MTLVIITEGGAKQVMSVFELLIRKMKVSEGNIPDLHSLDSIIQFLQYTG